MWYFRKRGNKSTSHELISSINGENDVNTISINPFHTLQLKRFDINDSGVYLCKYFSDFNKYFTYVLDGKYICNKMIFKNFSISNYIIFSIKYTF